MKTVKDEMDIDKQERDLDLTHHAGNPKVCKDSKPRSIIIIFARYDVRSTVYKNKEKLKSKNILIKFLFNSNTCWFVERSPRHISGMECLYDGRILYKENNKVFLYKK